MPNPIKLSVVIKTLEKYGFVFVSQKGSHAKYRKKGEMARTVIVKMGKKEIPHGTFQSILLLSGLRRDDFKE